MVAFPKKAQIAAFLWESHKKTICQSALPHIFYANDDDRFK